MYVTVKLKSFFTLMRLELRLRNLMFLRFLNAWMGNVSKKLKDKSSSTRLESSARKEESFTNPVIQCDMYQTCECVLMELVEHVPGEDEPDEPGRVPERPGLDLADEVVGQVEGEQLVLRHE